MTRFLEKVRVSDNGCHLWTGSRTRAGYAQLRVNDRTQLAHRWIWKQTHGPIPHDLTIDHLCRNRACVNPAHMELVTLRENVLRGDTIPAKHAQKTACVRGHPFTPENTYQTPPTRQKPRGQRQCRECNRDRALAGYHQRRRTQGG